VKQKQCDKWKRQNFESIEMFLRDSPVMDFHFLIGKNKTFHEANDEW